MEDVFVKIKKGHSLYLGTYFSSQNGWCVRMMSTNQEPKNHGYQIGKYVPTRELAEEKLSNILDALFLEQFDPFPEKTKLFYRETCGCCWHVFSPAPFRFGRKDGHFYIGLFDRMFWLPF